MKKTMLAMMILAGLCLLVGLASKVHILPGEFLNMYRRTWIDLAQLFLVAGIAFRLYGECCYHDKEKK